MLNNLSYTVREELDGKNLKEFLKRDCNISTRMIAKLKKENLGITRNGELIKTTDIVHAGDKIVLTFPKDVNEITPIKKDINIKYENDRLIIIDKEPYTPVHPTKIHQEDTLANYLSYYMNSKNEFYTFRCLNRLDSDTSGLVLIAKDRIASTFLQQNYNKKYYAICEGTITQDGTIDAPIKVEEGRSIQRVVSSDGESAITHYKVIKNVNNLTLLELTLETGRTHQIRCHLSYIGHPLCGDDMYGGSLDLIDRQALHCGYLSFINPIDNKRVEIISDLPDDMKKILK